MAIQRDPSGRLQIDSRFMGESMMDKSLLASTDSLGNCIQLRLAHMHLKDL